MDWFSVFIFGCFFFAGAYLVGYPIGKIIGKRQSDRIHLDRINYLAAELADREEFIEECYKYNSEILNAEVIE